MRRDGLAQWLGVNTSWTNDTQPQLNTSTPTNSTTNSTLSTPILFEPVNHANPVLVPLLHSLLDPPTHHAYYPQNLTGVGKGKWTLGNWSWEALRLDEAFNTTRLEPAPLETEKKPDAGASADKAKEDGVSVGVDAKEDVLGAGRGGITEPGDPPVRHRRAEGAGVEAALADADTKPGLELIAPIPRKMVNVTTTVNRTLSRGSFPWAAGGKLTLQLAEDQTSAVGPVVASLASKDDGSLMVPREGPMAPWEEEGPVTYLRGDLTFYRQGGGESLLLDIEGVHFLSQGTFYAFATPSSLPTTYAFEVPGLPLFDSLIPSANLSATAAGHAILREVDRRIERDRSELAANADNLGALVANANTNPFAPEEPECTFTLYGRIASLPSWYSQNLYAEYYFSLFHPTGSSLVAPPKTVINYVLYSEPCGLVLEGQTDMTPIPEAWSRATNLATILGIVQGLLLVLLVRQMEARASPNSLAKLAHTTIGMQAVMDLYTFIATFTVSVAYNSRASFPTLVPCFFALVGSLVFGMRHANDIRSSYPPPPPPPLIPPPPTREALAAAAAERRAATGGDGATAVPALFITPPAGDDDWVYLGLGLATAVTVLGIIIIWGWVSLLILIFYSYWIPQIILNVQRGAARMTLKREYIIGTTLCRLFLPVYFLGCPVNLLGSEPTRWVFPLILYSTLQATLLLLQDSRLGARFFLPASVLSRFGVTTESTWNYHPLLPPHDVEADGGVAKEDCPICMEEIDMGEGDKEERELLGGGSKGGGGGGGGGSEAKRWGYMVPPCHHMCHTQCLESWMQIKNVCPVCRGRLPPL